MIRKSIFNNYTVHIEQSEARHNLFGKIKSLNDRPRVSVFRIFIELGGGGGGGDVHRYGYIIRNIVLFPSQNRSKPNGNFRCKKV